MAPNTWELMCTLLREAAPRELPYKPYAKSLRMRLLTSLTRGYDCGTNIHDYIAVKGFSRLYRANKGEIMTNIKFVVRVSRGARAPAYVQRIGKPPFR